MGANVQVRWEMFCRYRQVELRLVSMVPGRLHLRGPEAAALCDENTLDDNPVRNSLRNRRQTRAGHFADRLSLPGPGILLGRRG
jgi:hypothetical protein